MSFSTLHLILFLGVVIYFVGLRRLTYALGRLFGWLLGLLGGNASNATGPLSVEAGFSPNNYEGERLVLRSLDMARHSIRLAAYSFTAKKVVEALINAKKRGVDVAVVVDHNSNTEEDGSGSAADALDTLVRNGIPVRSVVVESNSNYTAMQHSKYAVIDGVHVQTGSYNYSVNAARNNWENVLLVSNAPELANQYLANWQVLYQKGRSWGVR